MIRGINHYNLRSEQKMMEILKDFYISVVGLELGVRPPFKSKGYWLYAEKKDVLHLSATKNNERNLINVNSTFDHLAFTAENRDNFIKVLNKNNIIFKERKVPEIATDQIFFKDPAGNGIELIFTLTT
tara:strand:- start:1024 stop:1407 length:384 start_codon:yes stop_codon:yes gene_type:complete